MNDTSRPAAPKLALPRTGSGAEATSFGLIVFFLVFAYALGLVPEGALRDPDTLWHIRTGQWILEHGRWPRTDPFSYTYFGHPWIAKEWLSQVILAFTFDAGGWRAVVALTSAVYAGIAAVLAVYLNRILRFSVAIGLTLVTILLMNPHFLARPHLFGYLILSIWLFTLLASFDKKKELPVWMAGLMVLWANIHSTFVLGLVLFYVVAAFICIDSVTTGDRNRLRRTVIATIAVTFAVFITPYGLDSLLVVRRIMGMDVMMAHLTEWQPPNFRDYPFAFAYLIALFALIVALGIRVQGPRLIFYVIAMWLGFSYVRGFIVFALTNPFVFARPVARQYAFLSSDTKQRNDPVLDFLREQILPVAVVTGVLAVIAGSLSLYTRSIEPPVNTAPKAALEFVAKRRISGNVFNSYDFGGYLIFSGIPTFVDGRAELYGDDFLKAYFAAVNFRDRENSKRMLDEYKIDWVLLRPNERLAKALENLADWDMVYIDTNAVVFVRAGSDG
jgi:hypothetical protein